MSSIREGGASAAVDGGLAFRGVRTEWIPHFSRSSEKVAIEVQYSGMSMRDYFAAKAMQEAIRYRLAIRAGNIAPPAFDYDLVADTAYIMAAAMVRAKARAAERDEPAPSPSEPLSPREAQDQHIQEFGK